jgi:bacillithiol system protein YtxJ
LKLNWKSITEESQIEDLVKESFEKPVAIFKHSTTCSISQMSKLKLENTWDLEIDAYYLDLLSFRPISKFIAEKFSVHHESPQMILIHNGECVYDDSHFDINVPNLKEALAHLN